ncbi:unnamed protein product [Prorocentrum cordatum]|uniref:Uncharacterized protein n=1 Tax=Prorocentrum cordatum TaxID=2364126 RepID=A0ABN9SSE6_9DINO|nr:unnamed protein product [Polarella glacialis]
MTSPTRALGAVYEATRDDEAVLGEGWDEMVQAVLLLRLRHFEDARAAARQALRINSDLAGVIDELLPGMEEIPVWQPGPHPAAGGKYVICYNPFVGLGNLAVVMVSAHALAKITGRTFVLHWNINQVSRHAFRLKERPGVLTMRLSAAAEEAGVLTESARQIYPAGSTRHEPAVHY